MSKLIQTIEEAVRLCGLQDGMTVSFHHHLRNGDYVLNMVMDVLAGMGFHDLTINASSIHDVHAPLAGHIKSGVVTGLEANYIGGAVGAEISEGILQKPAVFRTHGGRAGDIALGRAKIDVAFIAAPTADEMGNCTGKRGPSACGSLGYAFSDAEFARKVIVITDHLVAHPCADYSIDETRVDYVVKVEQIGDPQSIVSGTTQITRDPVALTIAGLAASVIGESGYFCDGFAFQTGAGGASLATAACIKQMMLDKQIHGSFCMGGITKYMVDLLRAGCFDSIMDVQCFDLDAVESLRTDPRHREISAALYASPAARSALVDSLDAVVLGATQIDLDFNVNVHTDSAGRIMGGSGGHSDTAAGAKLTVIAAPLVRARVPVVTERVQCVSTPGKTVDVLVTQRGIAVNPLRPELADRLKAARLPVVPIASLYERALDITGRFQQTTTGERVVAEVLSRDGALCDRIYNCGA